MGYNVDYFYEQLFRAIEFEADQVNDDLYHNADKLKASGDIDYSRGYSEGLKRALNVLNNTHYRLAYENRGAEYERFLQTQTARAREHRN